MMMGAPQMQPEMGISGPPQMGIPGPMSPMQQGIGYDQYLPMMRERLRRRPMPGMRLPKAPPRFPTPGRMDGTRDYPARMKYGEPRIIRVP